MTVTLSGFATLYSFYLSQNNKKASKSLCNLLTSLSLVIHHGDKTATVQVAKHLKSSVHTIRKYDLKNFIYPEANSELHQTFKQAHFLASTLRQVNLRNRDSLKQVLLKIIPIAKKNFCLKNAAKNSFTETIKEQNGILSSELIANGFIGLYQITTKQYDLQYVGYYLFLPIMARHLVKILSSFTAHPKVSQERGKSHLKHLATLIKQNKCACLAVSLNFFPSQLFIEQLLRFNESDRDIEYLYNALAYRVQFQIRMNQPEKQTLSTQDLLDFANSQVDRTPIKIPDNIKIANNWMIASRLQKSIHAFTGPYNAAKTP